MCEPPTLGPSHISVRGFQVVQESGVEPAFQPRDRLGDLSTDGKQITSSTSTPPSGRPHASCCPGGRYVVVDSMSPDDPELGAFLDMVERRRDSTHVRSYHRDEWMHIIDRAGLQVERFTSHRKGRSFEFWHERGGVEGEDADKRREIFRDASDAAKEYFEIQIDRDVIKSFSDDKIVIRATSPAGRARGW